MTLKVTGCYLRLSKVRVLLVFNLYPWRRSRGQVSALLLGCLTLCHKDLKLKSLDTHNDQVIEDCH